jgi:hypothetical protein
MAQHRPDGAASGGPSHVHTTYNGPYQVGVQATSGGSVTVGGDVNANQTAHTTTHTTTPDTSSTVSDDLRARVDELLDLLSQHGLTRSHPVQQAAVDLRTEVHDPAARRDRIAHLLATIEAHAAQIAVIAAAVTAARLALTP